MKLKSPTPNQTVSMPNGKVYTSADDCSWEGDVNPDDEQVLVNRLGWTHAEDATVTESRWKPPAAPADVQETANNEPSIEHTEPRHAQEDHQPHAVHVAPPIPPSPPPLPHGPHAAEPHHDEHHEDEHHDEPEKAP